MDAFRTTFRERVTRAAVWAGFVLFIGVWWIGAVVGVLWIARYFYG